MDVNNAIRKLRQFFIEQQRLPSYTEMTELFGFSARSSAFELAEKLIKTGVIAKDEKGKLIPRHLFTVPHLGVIKAGHPMPAETIYGDSIDLYSFILGLPQDIFCLTVKGDSMIGALINEGDIALVQKNKEPRDGDIVAACVDGDCTLKFFRKDKKGVYLEAANDNYPIIRPKNSLTIEGVVINILRNYKK